MPPTPRSASNQWPVIVFTGVYMIGAMIATAISGNQEFAFYIAVMLILIAVTVGLYFRMGLTTGVLWCLSIWGLMHMSGGLVPVPVNWPTHGSIHVLYNLWLIDGYLKYDHVVHAFGFGTTTWVCWQMICTLFQKHGSHEKPLRPTLGLMVLCSAAGLGFGALNEIVEFIATILIPNTNVGGYINTGWDLVANLVGSVIGITLIGLFSHLQGGD